MKFYFHDESFILPTVRGSLSSATIPARNRCATLQKTKNSFTTFILTKIHGPKMNLIKFCTKNYYFYLYYKLYKFSKFVGTVDGKWTGLLLLSALVYFNVSYLAHILNLNIFSYYSPKVSGVAIILIIGAVNCFIFYRNKTAEKIIRGFENETKNQSYVGSLMSWLYVIITLYTSHYFIN